jgi:membrane protein implicated in regulation of membrane protease activity
MKILSTWTGVLIVLTLAVAMGAVGVYQYSTGQRATGAISAAVLLVVAVLLSRRILRRTR